MTVDKLSAKLAAYGIKGDLLAIINDFLTDRTQRTRVGSCFSDIIFLTSGIVQGSCLGPLLFLIFVNDIFTIFEPSITCKMYADDLKLYSIIESNYDNAQMQICLNNLLSWANAWQLSISIKKCFAIYIGGRATLNNVLSKCDFNIGNDIVQRCDSVVDLGISIDCNLKFSMHVGNIVRKSFIRSSLIHKCFLSKNIPTLVKAYKTFVLPLLEYNSPVWSPHLLKDINLIERVQHRFTKRLPGMYGMSYNDRLSVES